MSEVTVRWSCLRGKIDEDERWYLHVERGTVITTSRINKKNAFVQFSLLPKRYTACF